MAIKMAKLFVAIFGCLAAIALLCEAGVVKNTPVQAGADWYKYAVFYQIYPRSFKDSDNDGNGDLQGIIQGLSHIQDMGVDAIWLSPIYKSPQVDNGYDIADYRDVDPLYGTLDDLKQLINEAHKRNIKVILDYVPNHTSDQHAWFQASVQGNSTYADYYIWKDPVVVDGQRQPPNNWLSVFGGSAWEWNEKRQQYYFHQFAPAQPDLNYRNPKVVQDMNDVLSYWMDFDIDGFRMDAVSTLFEDASFQDEPKSGADVAPDNYGYLDHIYTSNQNETYELIYQWRALVDNYNIENRTNARVIMTEVYSDVEQTMKYYGEPTKLGATFTFNFLTFISTLQKNFTALQLQEAIDLWQDNLPSWAVSNWVLGNHDQTRVATRLGVENIDALNMLAALLPGAQVTYQGEEIGEENGEVTCEEGYDPQAIKNCSTFAQTSRDLERTPFQWDNSTNAGFNKGAKTWLPVSQKYLETNLANQNVTGKKSHYNTYKALIEVVKNVTAGDEVWHVLNRGVYNNQTYYIYRSTYNAAYIFLYNLGNSDYYVTGFACNLEIAAASLNSDYTVGQIFNNSQPLKPKEAIVARFPDPP